MRKALHSAFWRRWRDRLTAALVGAVALVPMGLPKEVAEWFRDQLPWAPSWLHWVLAVALAAWRLSVATAKNK